MEVPGIGQPAQQLHGPRRDRQPAAGHDPGSEAAHDGQHAAVPLAAAAELHAHGEGPLLGSCAC